jgi:hypothetical protein
MGDGLPRSAAVAESRSDIKLAGEKGAGLSTRFAGALEGAVVKVSFGFDSI